MKPVHVWVDADSCPRTVRDYIIKKAASLSFAVTFVANRAVPVDEKLLIDKKLSFESVICENTPGAADDYIAGSAEKGDMIVTRDIPLAAKLAERGLCVLNDRGISYTKESAKKKLADRNFNMQLAEAGLTGNKKNVYGKKEFALFAACFDKEIIKLIRELSLSLP